MLLSMTTGAWAQCELAKLLASDGQTYDEFGYSSALENDVLIIGALQIGESYGKAYVFRHDGEAWSEEAVLVSSVPEHVEGFGRSVAVNGNVVVVGAPYSTPAGAVSGLAFVFRRDDGIWSEEARLAPSGASVGDFFGCSVAVHGDSVLIGAEGYGDDDAGVVFVFTWDGAAWTEQARIQPSDATPNDAFGGAVVFDGERAVVGARYSDGLEQKSGSVYVFHRDGPDWVQDSKLLASDGESGALFGCALALEGDALVAGAFRDIDESGSAYLFRFADEAWTEEAKLRADDCHWGDEFGSAVALSGATAVIGARDDSHGYVSFWGSVYVFQFTGRGWSQVAKLIGSDGRCLGYSVALNEDTVFGGAIGADGVEESCGAVYLFSPEAVVEDCNGNGIEDACDILTGLAKDCQPNGVPDSCDIADGTSQDVDGDGVPDECEGDLQPCEEQKIVASDGTDGDWFGNAVSIDGDVAIIGAVADDDVADAAGSAYIERFDGAGWQEEAKLLASDAAKSDCFGEAVGISGDVAVVGAHGNDDFGSWSGSAYVFRYDGAAWQEAAKLLAPDAAEGDNFGCAVAIDGDVIVVAASRDEDFGDDSGSAYVFRFNGAEWVYEAKLLASDGYHDDWFGSSVSISGEVIIVGALCHDVHGAAYVFRFDGAAWNEEAKFQPSDLHGKACFGRFVCVRDNLAIVGAPDDDVVEDADGSAYIFEYVEGTGWSKQAKLAASDAIEWLHFGAGVAIDGDAALVVASASNELYLYRFDGAQWNEIKFTLGPSGGKIALDGDRAIVGYYKSKYIPMGPKANGTAYVVAGMIAVDCNHNGWPDACDIIFGTSEDLDGDGIPDECQCVGDISQDGIVDVVDLLLLLGHWGPCPPQGWCPGDCDEDGDVDVVDLLLVLGNWGPCE